MTTFTVSVTVRCGKTYCARHVTELVDPAGELEYCRFAKLRGLEGGTRNYCELFQQKIVTTPGTVLPNRCPQCLVAERQRQPRRHE